MPRRHGVPQKAAAVVGLLCGTCSVAVHAAGIEGHPSPTPGPAHSRVGVEAETGHFDLSGQKGHFLTVAARADYAAGDGVSFRARVPFNDVSLDGEPTARTGPGDVDLRFKIRMHASSSFLVFSGVTVQLPTGDAPRGLGGGAVQSGAFITAGYEIQRSIVYATIVDVVSVPTTSTHTVNYVDPNFPHELRTYAGAFRVFADRFYAHLALSAIFGVSHPDAGTTLLAAIPQLGVMPSKTVRVNVGAQLPVSGPRRFDWKLNAAAYFFF